MRIDFNVLWIDDQPESVRDQIETLEGDLKLEGFRLQVVSVSSLEEARAHLGQDIYSDCVDLILVDYHLGEGPDGDSVIKMVKETLPYKDVIFYSAQSDNLKNLLREADVQGVYTAHRGELTDTIMAIVGVLIKKVIDVDHARGMVMGASSSIEEMISECISEIYTSNNEKFKKDAIGILQIEADKIAKSLSKELEKIKAITDLREISKYHRVYSANDRIKLLIQLIQLSSKNLDFLGDINIYMSQTIPTRNLLGHKSGTKNGFKVTIFRKDGTELTMEDAKELRIALINHYENFENLLEAVKTA
ncbi:response regulator [Deinococcus sp. 12RED42]|uniref:response regulator n=1 Tax=Deinococcus sp. 12RED42 TaxID=2745872 RepID=UPI001E48797E|nr:response regulator [Deinococcus sp. 12RED42]MCD0164347.1 response regulator [Deinococcus sp. 12RED42]